MPRTADRTNAERQARLERDLGQVQATGGAGAADFAARVRRIDASDRSWRN